MPDHSAYRSRQVLALEPENGDALHLLGLLAHQAGRNDIASELLDKAIDAEPLNAEFLKSRGEIFRALGRFAEAESCYRRANALKPEYAEAHNNLAIVLQIFGRPEESDVA